jgi:hypothetical protein
LSRLPGKRVPFRFGRNDGNLEKATRGGRPASCSSKRTASGHGRQEMKVGRHAGYRNAR